MESEKKKNFPSCSGYSVQKARKRADSSAVKIAAYGGRLPTLVKSGKTAPKPTPASNFESSLKKKNNIVQMHCSRKVVSYHAQLGLLVATDRRELAKAAKVTHIGSGLLLWLVVEWTVGYAEPMI